MRSRSDQIRSCNVLCEVYQSPKPITYLLNAVGGIDWLRSEPQVAHCHTSTLVCIISKVGLYMERVKWSR
jgi:hypothetical protein